MSWQPIETAPIGSRKVILLIAKLESGYITDPWAGWINNDGTFARWPHSFPPTHWMPIPPLDPSP